MILDLGTVRPGSTIRIPFNSFDKDDGSSITMTNYAAADMLVYKDGGTTERASTAGYTATTDFDGKTGKHLAIIDLADNTTAGFWNAGSEYLVALDAVTVDAVTVGGWIARFRIGYTGSWMDTTIATLSSQTSFTLTTGPAEDDAINGRYVIIHDLASAVQCGQGIVLDYTGSTKTVTLVAGTTFTAAAGDNISVMGLAPLQATTVGRTLDVSSGGEAGVDWANVGSPTTSLALTGTTIATTQKVDVETIKTQAVTAAAGVTFPTSIASPTNITAGTITTATNLTNAPTNGDFTATMKTSIGTAVAASAVASVTGNPGGNVTGSVGSVAANGITSSSLATSAVDEIVDGVFDENVAAHAVVGSFGEYLTEQASALDAGLSVIANIYTDTHITGVLIKDGGPTVFTFAAGAIDAAAIAANAITDAKVAADVTIASVTGAVGSVTATVNADVKKINGTTVNGNGSGTPWGP
jgi:hypothetical protein